MFLANSNFNFFNKMQNTYKHETSNNVYSVVKSRNFLLLFGLLGKKYDSLNHSATGIVYKQKKVKKLILKNFLNCFIFQWVRVNFRGKSFRVRNFCNKNKFTLNFGYSHWTKVKLLNNWAFFKKKRQHFVMYTFLLKDFLYFSRFWPYIKFYNCYTMRGLRFKKQAIIRRFGKISQHISSLH